MKKKIQYLTYAELCEKFGEETKPKGNFRQQQKKRFEKQGYTINWDNELRKYEVIPLTKTELTKKMKNCNMSVKLSVKDFAEPIIISHLLPKEGEEATPVVKTSKELANLFGLVNERYNEVYRSERQKEELSDDIDVSKTKIEKFQSTVDELNWQVVKNILTKLQDNKLIIWERCYEIWVYQYDLKNNLLKDEDGNPIVCKDIIKGKENIKYIMNMENELAYKLSGKPFYALTEEEKIQVNKEVCDKNGYERYWYSNYIEPIDKALAYEFDKKFNRLNNKLKINKQNHVKIVNSTRGDFFKALEEKDKIKLINSLIDIKKDEVL